MGFLASSDGLVVLDGSFVVLSSTRVSRQTKCVLVSWTLYSMRSGIQGSLAIQLRIRAVRPVARGPWPAHAGSQSSKDLPPQESDIIKATRR